MLDSDIIGTGSAKRFGLDLRNFLEAMKNIRVFVPSGFFGKPPKLTVSHEDGGKLIFDLGDVLFHVPSNIKFDITVTGSTQPETEISISNGVLTVSIT